MTVKLNLRGIELGGNRDTLKLGSTVYYKRKAGQFIYGKQNFFNGSMAIIPIELDGKATSGDVPSLEINGIDSDYLYTYVSRENYWRRKESAASGTGSKRIHESTLLKFEISVPTGLEQFKISKLFNELSNLITLHQRQLDSLKKPKKSFLQKLFSKTGAVKPEIRFTGFTDDWEQRKLNELTSYQSSSYSSRQFSKSGFEGEFPVFDANKEIARINEYAQEVRYISIIKDGAGIGRTELRPAKTSIIGTMGYILSNESDINFVYSLMQNIKWAKFQNGSTIPHVYYKDYGNERFYVPEIDEQTKIGQTFNYLDHLITLRQRQLFPYKISNLIQKVTSLQGQHPDFRVLE